MFPTTMMKRSLNGCQLPLLRRPVQAALALLLWPVMAGAQCDDRTDTTAALTLEPPPASQTLASAGPTLLAGREQLAALSKTAVLESPDIKAAELGRTATEFDIEQIRASKRPRLDSSVTAGAGRYSSNVNPRYDTRGVGAASLSLSAPLYDGGRIDSLTRQREELFEASTASLDAVRERVTLDTLLTVLERNRYRTQLNVLDRHVTKLACLSNLIDRIVDADKGRASEQIQARNSLRQAELVRDQTAAAMRYADVRLQTILAGQVMPWPAIGAPLVEVPALEDIVGKIRDNPDVRQLQREAQALAFAANAAAAELYPQVRAEAGVNSKRQADRVDSQSWNAGVTLNYTFADGGVRKAAVNAANARAQAVLRTLDQAVADRNQKAGVLHDTALSAYRRASQYSDLLRDSDSLRRATYVQWSSLGRRSLFDLMSAENAHNSLHLDYVNAMFEGFSATAQLRHVGGGLLSWVAPDLPVPSNRP
jgi:adhesin transport system outer membrane protein